MFIRNRNLFFLLFWISFLLQIKAQDTLYVNEEVVINDTIYLKSKVKLLQPLSKASFSNSFDFQTQQEERMKDWIEELKKNAQKVTKIKRYNPFSLNLKSNILLINHNLFKNEPNFQDTYLGLGIDLNYRFKNNIIIGIAPMYYYGISKQIKTNETIFNGFYFVNKEPYLLENIEKIKFQWLLPVYIAYPIKRFKPSIGFFYNPIQYSTNFTTVDNGEIPQFTLKENYEIVSHQFGFLFGLNFQVSKRIELEAQYLLGLPRNFSLKNTDPQILFNQQSQVNMFSFGVKVRL